MTMRINSVKYLITIILLCVSINLFAGNPLKNNNGFKFWNLKSISGLIAIDGHYRSGTVDIPGYISDNQKSTFLSGQLEINTSSFIWHPNFFQLDANFGYRPYRNLDLYIISPDNSEINTTERIDLSGILFSERIISINPYFNINHSFSRREYTTNLETFYTNYGARISSPGILFPTNINVSQNDWKQNEIQTGRKFSTNQFNVNAEISKSFTDFNINRFNIDYINFQRDYTPSSVVKNKSLIWNLSNNFLFDRERNFNLYSRVSLTNRKGTQPLNRLIVSENIFSDLPANFRVGIRYQYNKIVQDIFNSNQNDIEVKAEHNLFESLRSHTYYNYVDVNQTFYKERMDRAGLGFNYRKKIPTGILRLNYEYSFNNVNRNSSAGYINIIDEEKILVDGSVVLLNNPFVDLNSIIVKDASGTIIYQENFDYRIIKRGSYTEIQRMIGGQISNGSTVLISYRAEQQPSVVFNSNINIYGASATIFNNFLEVYFRATDQSYNNDDLIDSKYLKTLNQKLYGIRITYEYLDIGAEYEDYKSNITPYNSLRYFIRVIRQAGDNIISTITGNYRIYNLLDDNTKQKFGDISLSFSYLLSSMSRISLEGNYIVQSGRQIDLNLTNIQVEYITSFRLIDFSLGYQFYNRLLLGDKTRYSGIFAKISRRF